MDATLISLIGYVINTHKFSDEHARFSGLETFA